MLGSTFFCSGTQLIRHARYAVFQMAEAALPREVCREGGELYSYRSSMPASLH